MTKKELLAKLEKYTDDQYIGILMELNQPTPYFGWKRVQIGIQDIIEYDPWYGDHKLVGIVCHESNKEIKTEKC